MDDDVREDWASIGKLDPGALRFLVDLMRDAIVITTADLERPGPLIVYVNPAFEKMTGYTLDEMVGQSPRMLQGARTSRHVMDRMLTDLRACAAFDGEAVNYRKDGSEYILRWSVAALRDNRDRITGWISIQRDMMQETMDTSLRRRVAKAEDALSVARLGLTSPDLSSGQSPRS